MRSLSMILSVATIFCGANAFADTSPSIATAKDLIENGKCVQAADALKRSPEKTDEVYSLLGQAQLCIAKVKFEEIRSLYQPPADSVSYERQFTDSISKLLPVDSISFAAMNEAANSFRKITSEKDRNQSIEMVNIAKAMALIGKYSADGLHITRADISTPSCFAAHCDDIDVAKDCPATGMSDADALEFGKLVSGTPSSLDSMSDVAQSVGLLDLPGSMLRCIIVKMLAE